MAKERIAYTLRYEDAYRIRRSMPFADRIFRVREEISCGKNMSYQVIGRITGAESAELEARFGKFPIRVERNHDMANPIGYNLRKWLVGER